MKLFHFHQHGADEAAETVGIAFFVVTRTGDQGQIRNLFQMF